jgi:hypothetical protein
VRKCQITPIRCSEEQVVAVQAMHFPCKYLGVPLLVFALKKADLMPLVDAVAGRLPTWKANTLSAIPIHTSLAVTVSPWIYNAIDRVRLSYVWAGTSTASGGKCMVAWARVTRPVELGGLGILDPTTMGYALRLHWEWLARTDRPGQDLDCAAK